VNQIIRTLFYNVEQLPKDVASRSLNAVDRENTTMSIDTIFTPQDEQFYAVKTHAAGPQGALPLTPQMLLESPSGNLFGMTQNAGMGWDANKLTGREVLLIGTQGGIRHSDGRPIALGYHTGHWEIGLQMSAAAKEITRLSGIPFAAFVSDPCDGRSQGTHGMFDSLPYRNDAAIVFRRLIRSLPTRRAVIGVATCDKGLPATMIALASMHDLPVILVPGGATLPPTFGEDAGKVQTIGARYANNELSLKEASELGCRACASPAAAASSSAPRAPRRWWPKR
jgi:dihydroxyacid dehydratase/phosphogluconate dehydratase